MCLERARAVIYEIADIRETVAFKTLEARVVSHNGNRLRGRIQRRPLGVVWGCRIWAGRMGTATRPRDGWSQPYKEVSIFVADFNAIP